MATRIAGHSDAILDGTTGVLVDHAGAFAAALEHMLGDEDLRGRMARDALAHAANFTWGATACGTLEVLAAEALRRTRA